MENDAISRSELQRQFDEKCIKDCAFCPFYVWVIDGSDDEGGYCGLIQKAAALDVEPVVHARWTDDGECTRCGCTAEYTEYATERYDYDWDENLVPCGIEYQRSYHETDYCPNCGARMDGDEE